MLTWTGWWTNGDLSLFLVNRLRWALLCVVRRALLQGQ
jgi:hypothetical protein